MTVQRMQCKGRLHSASLPLRAQALNASLERSGRLSSLSSWGDLAQASGGGFAKMPNCSWG
jgi:hypothetical protein